MSVRSCGLARQLTSSSGMMTAFIDSAPRADRRSQVRRLPYETDDERRELIAALNELVRFAEGLLEVNGLLLEALTYQEWT
jgi:hypothetical protein